MFYIIIIAVQIHFDHARKHWVSSSCINGIVQLYDSSSKGTISDSLQSQLVAVYKDTITEDALMVTIISMQQQIGVLDCGLFGIATAFNVAMGSSVCSATFEQSEMRSHLEKCFVAGRLDPFPTSKSRVKHCRRKIVEIHVYCVCQKIESYDLQMIQCDSCQKWYHFKCVNLTRSPDTAWYCLKCSPPLSLGSDSSISSLSPPTPSISNFKSGNCTTWMGNFIHCRGCPLFV